MAYLTPEPLRSSTEPDGDTESSAYDSQDEKLPTPSQPTNLSASSSSQLNSTLSHPSATGTIPHRVQAQSATTASPSSATISGKQVLLLS